MTWQKKFKVPIPIGDRQLMAVGLIVTKWSVIETFIISLAHSILDGDPDAKSRFDEIKNFRKRLRTARDLMDIQVIEPCRTVFLQQFDRVGSLVRERDIIVHGVWTNDDPNLDDPLAETDANRIVNWGPIKPNYNQKISYHAIMNIAHKIDGLQADMFGYFAELTFEYSESSSVELFKKLKLKG